MGLRLVVFWHFPARTGAPWRFNSRWRRASACQLKHQLAGAISIVPGVWISIRLIVVSAIPVLRFTRLKRLAAARRHPRMAAPIPPRLRQDY